MDDIVEVRLPNGETALITARSLDGAGATGAGVGRFDLDSVSRTLEGVAEAVQAGLTTAAPTRVRVELAMEFAVRSGALTTLIVDGRSKGSLTVTLEWDPDPVPEAPADGPPDAEPAGAAEPSPPASA